MITNSAIMALILYCLNSKVTKMYVNCNIYSSIGEHPKPDLSVLSGSVGIKVHIVKVKLYELLRDTCALKSLTTPYHPRAKVQLHIGWEHLCIIP